RAESIVDIKIAQLRQRFGELWIVRFLARMEADVLEQCDIAIIHVTDDFFRDLPDRVGAEGDGMFDQRMKMIGHWSERIFFDRLSLRAAEMRHQDRLRALLA